MDKASDYGSGDSRFESWQDRIFFFFFCIKLFISDMIISNPVSINEILICFLFFCLFDGNKTIS